MMTINLNLHWPEGDYDRAKAVEHMNQLIQQNSGEDPCYLAMLFADAVERLAVSAAKNSIAYGGNQGERQRRMDSVKNPYLGCEVWVTEEAAEVEANTLKYFAHSLACSAFELRNAADCDNQQYIQYQIKDIEDRLLKIKEKLNAESKA